MEEIDDFDIEIKVSDPEKVGKQGNVAIKYHPPTYLTSSSLATLGDGMGAYMQYKVTTTVSHIMFELFY